MWKFIKLNKIWIGLSLGLLGLFLLFQFAVDFKFGDPDSFYHLKVAQLIIEDRLTGNFSWLQYSTWNNGYADQHYLFHLLLVPFVYFKVVWLVIPLFSSLMLVVFWWLLQQFSIKGKAFWVLLLLVGSTDFLFRINILKANTLSLVLLFAAIILLQQKKYSWLVPLAFLFVWTYGGFVFLPILIVLWSSVALVSTRRLSLKPIVYCLTGIAAGIALHPQAAHLLPYLYDQIFQAGLGANKVIPVGVEWGNYSVWYFLESNASIIIVWLIAVGVFVKNVRKDRGTVKSNIVFFLLSLFFWLLTLRHRRFIEYSIPFALLFSAHALNPYLEQIEWPRVKILLKQYWQLSVGIATAAAILVGVAYVNIAQAMNYFQWATVKDTYRGAATWLVENSQDRDIVFNPQWDQFPQLFYWNDKNYYIIGMDPTFMYIYDKNLYWQWRKVSDDRREQLGSEQDLHGIIKNDFQSAYLFVEKQRNPNLENLLQSGSNELFEQVYQDNAATLYQVK